VDGREDEGAREGVNVVGGVGDSDGDTEGLADGCDAVGARDGAELAGDADGLELAGEREGAWETGALDGWSVG